MRMKTMLCFLLVLGGAPVSFGQLTEKDLVNLTIRLWAPEDIEEFYQQMLVEGDRADQLTAERLASRAKLMRQMAYSTLLYWPLAAQSVSSYTLGDKSLGGRHRAFGKDLLRAYWDDWVAAWFRQFQETRTAGQLPGWAANDQIPNPPGNAVVDGVRKFQRDWGPLLQDEVPIPVPKGFVPEEVDGRWFLTLEQEQVPEYLKIVFVKRRGLLGFWDDTNTDVAGIYAGNAYNFVGSFPNELAFLYNDFGPLVMFELMHYNLRWVYVNQGYTDVVWTGTLGHDLRHKLIHEVEYPILLRETGKWTSVRGQLKAVLDDSILNLTEEIDKFHNEPEENYSRFFRQWAGDYRR